MWLLQYFKSIRKTQNIFEIRVIDQSNTVKTMTQHFDFVSKNLNKKG